MPFRHGYKRKRYVKPTRRFTRTKVGYRKYSGKASSLRTRKPARFAFSRKYNRLNTAVARSIRGMAETKVIALRQQDWTQPAAAPTAPGVSTVKFITGSGSVAGYTGYNPVEGFRAPQGDGKNNRDGQFIWLKHTSAALTIQMDHAVSDVERCSAIRFRVIVFKAKRALNPTGQTTSPDTNLFLQNNGNNQGDSSTAVNAMNVMDMMLQPCNTNSFYIMKDTQFTLQHTTDVNQSLINGIAQTKFPSAKTMRLRFTHNTKARIPLNATDEPIDYDYRFGIAIYAFYPNQAPTVAADVPLTWSTSIRGTTCFNDV